MPTETVIEKVAHPMGKSENGHPPQDPTKHNWFYNFTHEPFVHFIFLGILIFFIGDYFKKHHFNEQYEIRISNKDVYRIASLWEKQYGSIPSPVQLQSLLDNYIREEILYREGLEAGLIKDDEVVRRRIAQKQEFLFQDLAVIEDPTNDQLKKYYEEKKSKYAVPEKLSFSHIYFSPDIAGEDAAVQKAKGALQSLQGTKVNRAPELGDRFAYLYDYSNQSKEDIYHLFGGSVFTDSIFYIPAKQWYGPVRSGYGWHLVYVNGISDVTYQPLEEIVEKVKADYIQDTRDQKNAESYQKLERKYIIIKDYEIPGSDKK
jgi:peptidyl-prolyl cis-trans isomerase C